MQVLIPISGYSSFFPKEEYYFPKPLLEIAGRPMIELVIQQFKSQFVNPKFVFVVDSDDVVNFSIDKTISLLAGPDSVLIVKNAQTSGSLCSCLLTIDEIDLELPLIISNSDQIIEDGLLDIVNSFVNRSATAGVASFKSVHPRWSYAISDINKNVLQTFEKEVKSNTAIAGFYYFEKAKYFYENAKQVILNDANVNGNFYISSVLNEIILGGGSVLHSPVSEGFYHSFYAPSKIEEFEKSSYAQVIRESFKHENIVNIVIPAAGEGSRFNNEGWKSPKPFIDIAGKPMIDYVIDNIKSFSSKITLLLRKEHIEGKPEACKLLADKVDNIVEIKQLTEGTASTVLLARPIFDNNNPLVIANSDQLVDFDINDFIHDCISRRLDGSILVFRDPSKNEKWSFASIDDQNHVIEVAEKKAISDLATVGIYLFSKGSDFVSAAIDMIAANERVNNEFYTCPVYNYMIRSGAKIGIYEVPMSAMSGLGTPIDLQAYISQIGAPKSSDCP